MPAWRSLLAAWPHARLGASEGDVGLPAGQMGNSEVGHLNIGAGRPVLQDLPRIDAAISDGSFDRNPALVAAIERSASRGRPLHLISLIGPGGVHANDRHLVAVADLARRHGVGEILVHALLDGRDTPPRSGLAFVASLEDRLAAAHPGASIATVAGRYYGMDRDGRWERTAAAYRAIVHGTGWHRAADAAGAIAAAYERGESDEFVAPTIVGLARPVEAGDDIVHLNFRADRARQLSHALVDEPFGGFDRSGPTGRAAPAALRLTTLTEYEAGLPAAVAFPPEVVRSLAAAFAELGLRQLHVAETEKYAHVTYFLNGGREEPFAGEDRILVPSPRVSTYDLEPAMSARGVADAVVDGIRSGDFDLIVANFANPDMVGHTGDWDATVAGLAVVDDALARIVAALADADAADPTGSGSLLVVTADHGNADELLDGDGRTVTAHSLNPVPLLIAGRRATGRGLRDGVLSDIAPTLLEFAAIEPWEGMTGRSLLV